MTAHLSDFPSDLLLPCSTRDQVETVFMSSLKEADQLKHSGKVVSQMQKKDHNQLWSGLSSDKFDQFWAINRKLMEGDSDTFRHVPAKFYLAGREDNESPAFPAVVQKLVSPGLTVEEMLVSLGWEGARCVLQGIEPDMKTPLLWLARHLAYPDNFLHIIIDRS